MPTDYNLYPGDILLFKKKKGFDLWGSVITAEERDTDVCHAAFADSASFIWTTGAENHLGIPAFYGYVKTEDYLAGKSFYICRYAWLTRVQTDKLNQTARSMQGQMYGIWKVVLLIQLSKLGGIVKRLHPWITHVVKNPFCSEAVAYCYWQAGLRICEEMGKEEPSAITPANIKAYAQMKGTPLNIIQEVNQ